MNLLDAKICVFNHHSTLLPKLGIQIEKQRSTKSVASLEPTAWLAAQLCRKCWKTLGKVLDHLSVPELPYVESEHGNDTCP